MTETHFLSKNVFQNMQWGISETVNADRYLGISSHISSLLLHLTSCRGVSDSLSGYFISHLILDMFSENAVKYLRNSEC